MTDELTKFCNCGGCTAKLDAGILHGIVSKLPRVSDKKLLIGVDTSDDAAVYRLNDDTALIQTLDFFTPIVADPFLFGKIAAANALSDVYAMGGEVLLALNIVCFPETMPPDILAEILRGGAEKVAESGGILCGGHTLNDTEPKYGLSVTGTVHPDKVLANNTCQIGDKLILTKPLGVGIVTTAQKMGEATESAYEKAVRQMEMLNKYAAQCMKKFSVHAATDVTGFGFLGHLFEMTSEQHSVRVDAKQVPFIPEAYDYAKEFFITAAGQKNRNYLGDRVQLNNVDFATQEILFDPQTSGGLLIAVSPGEADALLTELNKLSIKSAVVGEVIPPAAARIMVEG